ncbi:glycosyltransferase family 2 protein [Nonlabens xiamenensis]|uniref:glycosyltransferase family 2 protein n=1 Tax=Nonlabens xiamenensis TaxID=2341043 RepID=UPI000F60C0E6|nr:glycosyltransferase family 2 protein [Nonlabens xiamenensis]
MELSVVILNYNASAFLELCIHSVLRATQHIQAEIIVADNQSQDDSLAMLERQFGRQIKVLPFDQNHGFSKGNNLAIDQANGEYLCILNPDTLVPEHIFEECIAFAKSETTNANSHADRIAPPGFIGVQLIDGTGSFLPESKRHVPTPKVARQKLLGRDSLYYFNELDQHASGPVEILVGAFMFCAKEVFTTCGGFDQRYFMYGEDIDLSYTALLKGYQNHYLGRLTVVHFKGESTVKNKQYLQRFYGAMGLFYDKYFKPHPIGKYMIQAALWLAMQLKTVELPPLKPEPQDLMLVTNDEDRAESLNISHSTWEELDQRNSAAVLWDVQNLSFAKIILYMQTHPSKRYRFLSPSGKFYIGSDTSDRKGVRVSV